MRLPFESPKKHPVKIQNYVLYILIGFLERLKSPITSGLTGLFSELRNSKNLHMNVFFINFCTKKSIG